MADWPDRNEFTTECGEVISYDPSFPVLVLPENPPSAERGRRLAKRVLERMKEFSGPGCHGLHWLKVGRNVWESIASLPGLWADQAGNRYLHGLLVKCDSGMEPDIVCYYG